MSLAQQLTVPRLRALAGDAFARGDAYWRQQRVVSCEANGRALTGIVIGTAPYQVHVAAGPFGLVADCTCPVGAGMCKHAVALALHWLSEGSAPAPEIGPTFATRDELVAWAATHDVVEALATCATRIVPELTAADGTRRDASYLLGRLALRDVGARDVAARYFGRAGAEIAAAARAVLEREAKDVHDGLAEERRRIVPARRLAARLEAARTQIRAHAAPRSAAARARGTWRFDREAVAVRWTEPERIVLAGVAVPLAATLSCPAGGEPELACACDGHETSASLRDAARPGKPAPSDRGRCTHVLALIDATLEVLADPARAELADELERELLRPGWSRALAELARRETAPAPATIEVWWQLDDDLGGVTLAPLVRKATRRGGLSAGARVAPGRLLADHGERLDPADRRAAEELDLWQQRGRAGYPVRALAALAGHPRVLDDDHRPVAIERVDLGFAAVPHGDGIRLEPCVGVERMSPRLLAALIDAFEPGDPLVTRDAERCLVIEVSDDARHLWSVLARHGDVFPPEAHGELLDRLAVLEARLPVALAPELRGVELPAEPVVVVRVRLLPGSAEATLELEAFVRPGPGAPLFAPNAGPRDVLLDAAPPRNERGYVRRRLADEPALVAGLLARLPLGGAEEGPPGCFRVHGDAALALVQALDALPPGLEAEWIAPRPAIASAAPPSALRVQIDKRRDWFGITGELKLETGRLELAVLLDAARRQQRFVRLGEDRWVELSETLRARLAAIADRTFAGHGKLELSPGAVPAVRELEGAGAEVTTAPAWQALAGRLAASQKLRPRPPAGLRATLRDYQVLGHAWLARLAAWGAGACLADDMGLGKTVQAIALLLDRAKLGPALVLAPTSVAHNWASELARFAPGLRPVIYGEAADRTACLANLGKRDVLIASYGLLVRDVDALAGRELATLVFDEAQALKNPTTRRAKAARRLDAGFRVALSGTPLENHLGELWSLFAVVFPGLLGSWDQFRDRFATPIERGKDPGASAALSRVIRPFLLRRTKQEVARELPARTEIEVPIALGKDEWALYEDARLAAVAELSHAKGIRDEQRRFQVLAALTRLRLLASHPRLYDPRSSVASSKLRRLVELCEELRDEGHRALVFSQFTSHLGLVREELARGGFRVLYLDGGTPARERGKLIAAFQDGAADVFLISLKAGGTGINLTAADYVIHLDPWWNPAVEDQATDRAHRIGQTKPVTVYRLVARGTIEEQILKMHGDKRALVAGVLEGSDVAARLTTRELLDLLAAGPASAE